MTDSSPPIRVLRLRVKDKHASVLRSMACAVNFVWNYCNELGAKVLDREQRFIGSSEIQKYLSGSSKEGLCIGSSIFQQVAEEFATRRRQFKKAKLRWRVSDPKKSTYSLGWIPFKAKAVKYKSGQIAFQGLKICLWDSYGLSGYELRSGCFSEDSRGRWYLNVAVHVAARPKTESSSSIGIDLGLKDFLTTSSGERVEAQRFYRDLEGALASAQRANKSRRVKAIHAKIANRRKDALHKLSTTLAKRNGVIFVGDVNASSLARTRMAKSVLDAGWSLFRTMLRYKCDDAGVWFYEVDESYSTQTCSVCFARSGPRGLEGLGIRGWRCICGAEHDRDVNAARNILARGLARLAEGAAPLRRGVAKERTA